MNELLRLLLAKGAKLSETATPETIEYAAVQKITSLTEVNELMSKDLAEAKASAKTSADKLAEVEAKLAEAKLAETTKAKSEVSEMVKKAFTPAEVADEKHYINVLMSEGKFDAVKGICEKLGVTLKETKKKNDLDEDEDESEKESDKLDESKPWEDNTSTAKVAALKKHMYEGKMDESEPKDIQKAEAAVSKKHNEAYFKTVAAKQKKGGK